MEDNSRYGELEIGEIYSKFQPLKVKGKIESVTFQIGLNQLNQEFVRRTIWSRIVVTS